MAKILITGGSGLIGSYITEKLLKEGHEVAWMSRSEKDADHKKVKVFNWDVVLKEADAEAVEWCDHIIHLAGAGVADKRWTKKRKKEILESRTRTSTLLQEMILKASSKPQSVVCASGIGYYGFKIADEVLDETSAPGTDFLAQVTKEWERSTDSFRDLKIRTVQIRTGIVLSSRGGALKEMTNPPVMAPLGSGKQWMPWIHMEDLARMYIQAFQDENLSGKYNAAAPHPVRNKSFMQQLAKAAGKPYVPASVPGVLLKMVLGEMSGMILTGSKISCKKIMDAGFDFQYTKLDAALNNIYQTKSHD